eukprot:m.220645 g.220645  ORF g.220645 m.220645 type:complete len:555 (+) comp33323_c4_seq2:515-2179(+)
MGGLNKTKSGLVSSRTEENSYASAAKKYGEHKKKMYLKPPWVVRSLINTILFQASWSIGYAAAQLYYTALVIDLDIPNFVVIGVNDTLETTVPRHVAARAFGISMGLNVGFGVLTYLMVRFQLALNRYNHKLQGITVFVTKWVDNAADGATFFSTNLTYTSLITAVSFSANPNVIFWELMLFTIIIILFCITFTAVLESLPYLWHTSPNKSSITTNQMISDWYIGQWAWFMAFAGWTMLLSTFGTAYLNIYEHTYAWWILLLFIFVGYILYALLPSCCSTSEYLERWRRSSSLVRAMSMPDHRDRQVAMLKKSVSWLLGVGFYFTLKKTFPVFADALSQEHVDSSEMIEYVVGAIGICFTVLFVLELFRQRIEGQEFRAKLLKLETAADHEHEHEHDTDTTITTPAPTTSPSQRGGVMLESVELMLKLVACYITGKTLEAVALANTGANGGGTASFAGRGMRWQVCAGVAAIIHSVWELKTQRVHGDGHSPKCVCDVCHPEYYTEPHSGDAIVFHNDECATLYTGSRDGAEESMSLYGTLGDGDVNSSTTKLIQ